MTRELLMDALARPEDGGSPALLADDADRVIKTVLALFNTQHDIAAEVRRTAPVVADIRVIDGKTWDLGFHQGEGFDGYGKFATS